jgi:hypothetical protein
MPCSPLIVNGLHGDVWPPLSEAEVLHNIKQYAFLFLLIGPAYHWAVSSICGVLYRISYIIFRHSVALERYGTHGNYPSVTETTRYHGIHNIDLIQHNCSFQKNGLKESVYWSNYIKIFIWWWPYKSKHVVDVAFIKEWWRSTPNVYV